VALPAAHSTPLLRGIGHVDNDSQNKALKSETDIPKISRW
jgi:hypothetical protein